MSTNFEQEQIGTIVTPDLAAYDWSDAANWTNGVPTTGADVTLGATLAMNPSGYDDIATLSLDSLVLEQGYLAVTGTLAVSSVSFATAGEEVFADTYPGNASALLTIDSLSGSSGMVEALGTDAVVNVLAAADPGESYEVDRDGELELTALPNAVSSLSFASGEGVLAFRTLSGTITAALSGVSVGDAIALPGSIVSAVSFGAGALTITTNLGTTVFSDVSYGATKPTGYTVSTDPVSGLQEITFITAQSTTFRQEQIGTIVTPDLTAYDWSDAANWTNGVPTNGADVTLGATLAMNPSGYDDIATLSLDSLVLEQGYLAVTGTLAVSSVSFATAGEEVFADTYPGNASALLTIDSLSGSSGMVEALGTDAVVNVLAAADPGESYEVDRDGELELTALPNAVSSLSFASGEGVLAFRTLSGTITAALSGVSVGDAIALPGSIVSAVSFGAGALTITTNLGTTVFSDVSDGATKPTGYTVSTDPVSGLQEITFIAAQSTTFRQEQIGTIVTPDLAAYDWSDAANWTNGVPTNGADVTLGATLAMNPSGYDDIATLSLDSLVLEQGYLAVTGTLAVSSVSFATAGEEVFADTYPGNASALLTIDSLSGSSGMVEALGTDAVVNVLAAADPGESYEVDRDGELELTALPNAVSSLSFASGEGVLAFRTLSGTITAALSGVSVGDAIALPGSIVSAVSFGAGALTITTNLGTTVFSDVSYGATKPTGYTVSTDPVSGLQEIIFICYLRGTNILTARGEVPVEALSIGDTVVTRFGGYRRVKWIGRQSYDSRFLRHHRARVPVRILPGALGDGVPARMLSVSPGHSMLIGDSLVLAKTLVNGITITQSLDDAPDIVEYFQLELDSHDCILAEGAWSETYADAPGLRAQFHNAAEHALLYPDAVQPDALIPLCAPRPESGPALEAVLRKTVAIATAGARPGQLAGYLEHICPTRIEGWAMDASNPDLPVLLQLHIGKTLLGTILACDHRGDLLDAGKGNGNHFFSFAPAIPIPPNHLPLLRISRAQDGAVLGARTALLRFGS